MPDKKDDLAGDTEVAGHYDKDQSSSEREKALEDAKKSKVPPPTPPPASPQKDA
jgi:hypothetical protein